MECKFLSLLKDCVISFLLTAVQMLMAKLQMLTRAHGDYDADNTEAF